MGDATASDDIMDDGTVGSDTVDDPVRISKDQFHKVYEESFKMWHALWIIAATSNPPLPAWYLSACNAFPNLPALPMNLCLKSTKHAIHATAHSTWTSTNPDCRYGLTAWRQAAPFNLGTRHPVEKRLFIAESPDPDFH